MAITDTYVEALSLGFSKYTRNWAQSYQVNRWWHSNRHTTGCMCPLYRLICHTVRFCMGDVSWRNSECFPQLPVLRLPLSNLCIAWNHALNLWPGRGTVLVSDPDSRGAITCPSVLSFEGLTENMERSVDLEDCRTSQFLGERKELELNFTLPKSVSPDPVASRLHTWRSLRILCSSWSGMLI